MTRANRAAPQKYDEFSSVDSLFRRAVARFGDFSVEQIDPDVATLALDWANEIIEEVRLHPYHDDTPIPYYLALEDKRAIPDPIMVAGLLFHLAFQQGSAKVDAHRHQYYRTLNSIMYQRRYGNGRIYLNATDRPTLWPEA